jgi:hypothetical protein
MVSDEFIFEGLVDERLRVVLEWYRTEGREERAPKGGRRLMAARTIPMEGPVTPRRITRFSLLTTHRATNQYKKANLYCGHFICVPFLYDCNYIYWVFGDPIILAKSTRNQAGNPANRGGLRMLQSCLIFVAQQTDWQFFIRSTLHTPTQKIQTTQQHVDPFFLTLRVGGLNTNTLLFPCALVYIFFSLSTSICNFCAINPQSLQQSRHVPTYRTRLLINHG